VVLPETLCFSVHPRTGIGCGCRTISVSVQPGPTTSTPRLPRSRRLGPGRLSHHPPRAWSIGQARVGTESHGRPREIKCLRGLYFFPLPALSRSRRGSRLGPGGGLCYPWNPPDGL
jgi:hypothetical protein